MTEQMCAVLRALADKYETPQFSIADPSRVLRRYTVPADTECAAFIMAVLSFGRREQFLPKAEHLLRLAGEHPAQWIASGRWQADFGAGSVKFYRFYSYDDIRDVLNCLCRILAENGTLGEAVRHSVCGASGKHFPTAETAIAYMFPSCRAVSHGTLQANKRTRMFLRWMVRRNSPVDLGLWTWYSPRDLVIPLDTHVLQMAKALGIVDESAKATNKTALLITAAMREVWPDDPCKGDFALFGLGIEKSSLLAR